MIYRAGIDCWVVNRRDGNGRDYCLDKETGEWVTYKTFRKGAAKIRKAEVKRRSKQCQDAKERWKKIEKDAKRPLYGTCDDWTRPQNRRRSLRNLFSTFLAGLPRTRRRSLRDVVFNAGLRKDVLKMELLLCDHAREWLDLIQNAIRGDREVTRTQTVGLIPQV